MIKKVLKIVGIILFLLVAFAIAVPYLFKGKIIAVTKEQINKNINAKVEFKDIDISLFKHFPKVSVGLEGLQITGNDIFAADTLLSAHNIDVAINLMSIIKGKEMTIYSVMIESPRIHAIVTKEGLANWNIMKDTTSSTDTTAAKPFKMDLQKYGIHNAYISYIDNQSDMSSEIINLN
ncbi:MAG: AsmA family protein, partial [Sphingobacteriales bacterium]|nr:AsmA family protein [Sphingobacteriales bacterium]